MATKTVRIHRVWLDAFTEGMADSGGWPVTIDARLPQNAQIVDVGLAWRTFENPGVPDQDYPCVRYVEDLAEADPVDRKLYALQDGGTRDIPDDAEHLGVIEWPIVGTAVHLFGVRGPVDAPEAAAPAE